MNPTAQTGDGTRDAAEIERENECMTLGSLFDSAVASEELAHQVYLEFSRMFAQYPEVSQLWSDLSNDERGHRDLLSLSKEALSPQRLSALASPDLICKINIVEKIKIRADIDSINNMKEAYALAQAFEYSEINNIFESLMTIDGEAVRKEHIFMLVQKHMERFHEIGRHAKADLRRRGCPPEGLEGPCEPLAIGASKKPIGPPGMIAAEKGLVMGANLKEVSK